MKNFAIFAALLFVGCLFVGIQILDQLLKQIDNEIV